MSRLSIFAAVAVLSALTATPVAFAKEYYHGREAIPRWSYAAPRSLVQFDGTPSYNDPSKYGGGTALPAAH